MSTLNVANISDGTTTVGTEYVVNGSAKAWCHSIVTSGVPALTESFNVSSVTDVSTGTVDFNMVSAMSSTTFAVSITNQFTSAGGTGAFFSQENSGRRTTLRFSPNHYQNGSTADAVLVNGVAHGDLA